MHRVATRGPSPALNTLAALGAFGVTLIVLSTGPLAAQELVSGTWTGTIEAPGSGGPQPVEYIVDGGDEPAITMMAEGESLVFDDIELADGVLHFNFYVGVSVACALEPSEEGGFEGECVGDDGDSGYLTMVPPDGR